MNKLPFLLLAAFFSCQSADPNALALKDDTVQEPLRHNQELKTLYTTMQAEQKVGAKEMVGRVYQLLDSNQVRTALDYSRASMILYQMKDKKAVGLMKRSVEMDPAYSRTLFAVSVEKYLAKE